MATQTKNKTHAKTDRVNIGEKEAEFLGKKRYGRLATASREGQPHVVPIAYEFDGSYLYFSGWNLAQSLMYRLIEANGKVAMVVDEGPEAPTPWDACGVEIRGIAEIMHCHDASYVRITPVKSVSWGL